MTKMSGFRRVDPRVPFAVVVLIAAFLAVALPAAADPQSKLEKLQAKKEKAAAQEARYAELRTDLLGRVKVLDRKRAKVEGRVEALDVRLDALDARITVVKSNLAEAQQKVAVLSDDLQDVLLELGDSTELFTARAVEAYKSGPSAYLDSILDSDTFTDVVDGFAYWEAALDSDSELIDEISVLRDETEIRRTLILEKQAEIADAKRRLEQDREELAKIRGEHAEVLAAREALLSEKEQLLQEAEQKEAYYAALQDKLDEESREIESLLAGSSSGGPMPTGGGQFAWPTAGVVTSGYGYRTHPIFGDRRLHTGIDIGGGYGNPVVAAETGTVTYVGVMSGYGNVVIVDHGGGVATTYNHLSAFSVSQGSTVQRGTTVGAVGCTGYCTGPHLHFEVRVNGSPVDPMPYLQ